MLKAFILLMLLNPNSFNVTAGQLTSKEGQLYTSSSEMRATLKQGNYARLSFTYLGESKQHSKLGDGTSRQQFGLKLRARDTCNLIYVMWRFQPESQLVISVKANPHLTQSRDCRDGGYENAAPRVELSPILLNSKHVLEAELVGQSLRVWVDNNLEWEGFINVTAVEMPGPIGLRSDNVKILFNLEVKDAR